MIFSTINLIRNMISYNQLRFISQNNNIYIIGNNFYELFPDNILECIGVIDKNESTNMNNKDSDEISTIENNNVEKKDKNCIESFNDNEIENNEICENKINKTNKFENVQISNKKERVFKRIPSLNEYEYNKYLNVDNNSTKIPNNDKDIPSIVITSVENENEINNNCSTINEEDNEDEVNNRNVQNNNTNTEFNVNKRTKTNMNTSNSSINLDYNNSTGIDSNDTNMDNKVKDDNFLSVYITQRNAGTCSFHPNMDKFKHMAETEENLDALLKIALQAKRNNYYEVYDFVLQKIKTKSDLDFVVDNLMKFTINENPKRLNKIACYRNREMLYLLLDLLRINLKLSKTKKEKNICNNLYRIFCSGIAQFTDSSFDINNTNPNDTNANINSNMINNNNNNGDTNENTNVITDEITNENTNENTNDNINENTNNNTNENINNNNVTFTNNNSSDINIGSDSSFNNISSLIDNDRIINNTSDDLCNINSKNKNNSNSSIKLGNKTRKTPVDINEKYLNEAIVLTDWYWANFIQNINNINSLFSNKPCKNMQVGENYDDFEPPHKKRKIINENYNIVNPEILSYNIVIFSYILLLLIKYY